GLLAKSIKTGTNTRYGLPVARVFLKGKHAFLGYWMEYGVAPHLLSGDDADKASQKTKGAKVMKIGEEFVSGPLHHPGFAPKPFLRPAVDTKGVEAVQAIGDFLRDYFKFGSL